MPDNNHTASRAEPLPGALVPSGRCDICVHGNGLDEECRYCEPRGPMATVIRRIAAGALPAEPAEILKSLERVAGWDRLAEYIAGDGSRLIVLDGPYYLTCYPASGIAKLVSNWEAVQWLSFNLRRHTPSDEVCPSCKRVVKEGEPHMSEAGLERIQAAIREDLDG